MAKKRETQPVDSVPDQTIKPIAEWTPDEVQAYNLAHGVTEHVATITMKGWPVGDVLTALLPAVNGIHGGCKVCLEHFAERANAALAERGIVYHFRVTQQSDNANLGTVTLETE